MGNMKHLLLLTLFVVYTNLCFCEEDLPPEILECLKENDLDEQFLQKTLKEHQTSGIDDSKCFTFCLMEKKKLLDDSKRIRVDQFKENFSRMLSKDTADQIVEKCPEINDPMDCEKARSFQKCVLTI